jgi:hypothetical protein
MSSGAHTTEATPAEGHIARATTYCMGYWQVPENAKRPPAHYAELLPLTLRMLAGRQLIFLTDNVVVQRWIESLARQNSVRVHIVTRAVDSLPAAPFARQILHQTERYGDGLAAPVEFNREKGLLHYFRDLRGSGPVAYQKILAIWLSKVLLMGELMQADPFDSQYLAWVDATAARFNGQRANWDFIAMADRPGVVAHYASAMRKNGKALSINASYLKADAASWTRLVALYLQQLQRAVDERYPNDEETILHELTQAHPDLFRALDDRPVADLTA